MFYTFAKYNQKNNAMKQTDRANFGSKLGIILATAGSAVGLGNVWRFPYMAGNNGGAAFIVIYLCCMLLLGIPCMLNEFIIGRHAQTNMVRAYSQLSRGTMWVAVGILGVFTGFVITSYYAVVSGWCLQYIWASALGQLQGDTEYVKNYFLSFEQDPLKPIFWTVAFMLVTHFVIVRGVQNGIERASKMMMPTLFVLLLVIVVAACTLPGAWKGVEFLLRPDFSQLTPSSLLDALGQTFYSLSVGMGCLCTFASYFKRDTNLTRSAVQIAFLDTMVAVLAGLVIFPAAFSVGINPDSGPSLVFITLPNVFNQAFHALPIIGYLVSILFYALLALAALTSLISLHEVSTVFFHEELNISRKKAAWLVTISCSVIGALCSLSLGRFDSLQLFGMPLFELFDFVSGQVFLPIGGFLTCIFVGWYLPKKLVRDEFTNNGTLSSKLFSVYLLCVKFLCPLLILLVFLNQFGLI